jgi:hypothetical protein
MFSVANSMFNKTRQAMMLFLLLLLLLLLLLPFVVSSVDVRRYKISYQLFILEVKFISFCLIKQFSSLCTIRLLLYMVEKIWK